MLLGGPRVSPGERIVSDTFDECRKLVLRSQGDWDLIWRFGEWRNL